MFWEEDNTVGWMKEKVSTVQYYLHINASVTPI